jgi:hypothetical protein
LHTRLADTAKVASQLVFDCCFQASTIQWVLLQMLSMSMHNAYKANSPLARAFDQQQSHHQNFANDLLGIA